MNVCVCLCVFMSAASVSLIYSIQQTRDIEPMLVQCWADVADDGPNLNPSLIQRLVFAGNNPNHFILFLFFESTLNTYLFYTGLTIVHDAGPALKQHLYNGTCLFG